MSVRIQLKRSTASTWASANPTLAQGEIGYETDTAKFKIGTGSTAWNSLGYSNANLGSASLDALSDVTITSAANGDFLRWNGSAWINDAVNLSTDTVGNYVESLVAGTGVTLTNNSGEASTPTVAIGQAVGTGDSPSFAGVTADAIKIGVTAAGEIDTTSGNLTIDSAGGTVTIDDDLVVSGNLTVSGTTTTLNTETLAVEDNIIVLNSGITGSPSTNAGVEIERGTSTNVVFRWNESTDKWQVTENGTDYYDVTNSESLELRLAQEHWHKPVKLGTDAILPNSPTYTAGTLDDEGGYGIGATLESATNVRLVIDGTNATTGDRVLVKNQVNALHNGVYIVTQQGSGSAHWILTRASDMNGSHAGQITIGESVAVQTGTNNYYQQFSISSTGTGTSGAHIIGTDNITFVQYTGTASFNAGSGLATTGNTLNVVSADSGRINVTADSIDLAPITQSDNSGAAGLVFVSSVTRDGYGRVTGVTTSNVEVTLGTNTTGNYVQSLIAGTGVTLTNNTGETATPTVAIGQAVGTTSDVTFNSVTASLTGNASTATKLATARTIAGQSFDGSANISIAPTDLTGVTATAAEINTLDGITASTAELNILDGVTSSAAELNILDGATVSAAELNILDGATLTTTELNYVDGVTSAIQTQLDNKASATASPVITLSGDLSGSVTLTNLASGTLTATIAANSVALGTDTTGNYMSGVTQGTGVTVTHTPGEGSNATIAIGQAVGTSDSPTFAGINVNGSIVFEGATANEFETTLVVADPTADNTVTIPDRTGTVVTTGDTGTVTSTMIADGTIVNGDINASAGIALSKLATSTAGNIIVYNSSGVPTSVAESGDVTISDTGVTAISSGVIVNADINASAAIDKTKISGTAITAGDTGTVTSTMIADGTIVNGDINASAAIALSKLAIGSSGQLVVASSSGVPTYTTISGDATISDTGVVTIAANAVALGTDTTGDYVASLVAGTGVTLTNNSGESATPTVAIGQAVGTASNVQFANITATGTVTLASDPASALQAATKQYVDNVASGINFHEAVVAATTGNLAGTYNNGTSGVGATLTKATNGAIGTIDGATVVVGSRILLKSQTDPKENGIYTVTAVGSVSAPWVVTRATDADNNPSGEMKVGDFCFVTSGSTNAGFGFVNNSTGNPIVIGTDSITYTTFNAAQTLTAGSGISIVSNVVSVDTATIQARVANVTDTEIGYLDGVSSAIQTQLDAKAPINNASFTGTFSAPTGTITSTMITDGTIVNGDINASAGIALSKLASGTAGQIIVANSSGVPTWVSESGDISISDSGVTAIEAGVIVNADINASAAIALSKLASGTSGQIIVANASGVPTWVSETGDISISDTGVTAISSGVIVDADVSTSAAIAHSKLANATAGQVLLGTTTTGVITATAITGDITINGAGVATIAANSVALGTDTTGNYVNDISAGTGVTVTHTPAEGSSPTIAIGQAVGTASNVTFANVTATGLLTVGTSTGGEGGQIELLPSATGTTVSGNVVIDIAGNQLRIFEKTGNNRGAFIDLTACNNSVGTNLLGDVTVSAQTASYTLTLQDKGDLVEMLVATGNTLTVPPNSSVAFPVGTQINILQTGAGQTTVTAGAGVTINGTPGLKLRAQWSYATLIKRATDTWVLVGDISA
jgi:trimeric autotransporter adhesin